MGINEALSNEFKKHTGKTVTIYTASGGDSGKGFTGILINANNHFIRLIKEIPCSSPDYGSSKCNCCKRFKQRITIIIPINRIAAFVYIT